MCTHLTKQTNNFDEKSVFPHSFNRKLIIKIQLQKKNVINKY